MRVWLGNTHGISAPKSEARDLFLLAGMSSIGAHRGRVEFRAQRTQTESFIFYPPMTSARVDGCRSIPRVCAQEQITGFQSYGPYSSVLASQLLGLPDPRIPGPMGESS